MSDTGHGANRERAALAGLFWLAVVSSAIHPVNPTDYVLEIAVPVLGFALLAATARRFPFTALSCRLMLAEALVLAVGAHYTHERVPLFDWLKPLFGWERNHYDRFAHFCVGLLLVVPLREILLRATTLRGRALQALSVVGLLAFAGFYEITEWWIAVLAAPGTAEAYLGAQGDPWDAQKDMLLDTLGAVLGLVLFSSAHDRGLRSLRLSTQPQPAPGSVLSSATAEFRKLKALAEKALAQVDDEALDARLDAESNSLAILARHVAGNLISRWTDLLTTDGEKPDRDRDGEFDVDRRLGRPELMALWERGWTCLFDTLASLGPDDLARSVRIRGEALTVVEALDRQLAHYGQHVGQIVFLAKHLARDRWRTLSIPRARRPQ